VNANLARGGVAFERRLFDCKNLIFGREDLGRFGAKPFRQFRGVPTVDAPPCAFGYPPTGSRRNESGTRGQWVHLAFVRSRPQASGVFVRRSFMRPALPFRSRR